MPLAVGASAPNFTLTDQDGHRVSLSKYRNEQVVVLYFYPKDNTRGCTAQACGFRDAYEDFTEAGAVVIGVSTDGQGSHRGFVDKHRLPFTLVTDGGGALAKTYDVGKTFGLIPGRVTFVIDRNGVIQHVFDSQINAKKHVSEALTTVKRLR